MQNHIAHGRKHNDLTGRRDRGARQIDHGVGRRVVRFDAIDSVPTSSVHRRCRRRSDSTHSGNGNLDSDVRTRELIDLVDAANLLASRIELFPELKPGTVGGSTVRGVFRFPAGVVNIYGRVQIRLPEASATVTW